MPKQDVITNGVGDDFSTEEDDDPDERDNRHLLSKSGSGGRKSLSKSTSSPWRQPPGPKKWKEKKSQTLPNSPINTSISGSIRHVFGRTWLNVLLIFVPFGIAAHVASLNNQTIIFALNAIAIIPLTALLTYATENVAHNLGVGMGALLNITFGNLVELVILIFMLREGHLRIVLASLLGSIFVNLLFILGLAIMSSGLRHREQMTNQKVTQMLVFFMTTGVLSILIPTSLHACVRKLALADSVTLKFSRGLSITLLFVYAMFLHFQMSKQSNTPSSRDVELFPIDSEDTLTESAPKRPYSGNRDRETRATSGKSKRDEEPQISRLVSMILLLSSAAFVSLCAEFMVDSIEHVVADAPITEAFLGLIILPLLGNVSELGTAVTVAVRQKIDLAINVTVGSAIQISLFMAPVMVLLSWLSGKELSLHFDIFQTVALLATMLIVNIMMLSGRSNYLLGVLLFACYIVIGTGAFFLPNQKGLKMI